MSQPPPLRAVLLDTGPLGLASNPRQSQDSLDCNKWIEDKLIDGIQVIIPEIADYELRRALIRAGKTHGLANLDILAETLSYLPLSPAVMRQAARLWADARSQRRQTPDPHALDGDVILAAQALSLGYSLDQIVVATTNPAHLSPFVPAMLWRDIA